MSCDCLVLTFCSHNTSDLIVKLTTAVEPKPGKIYIRTAYPGTRGLRCQSCRRLLNVQLTLRLPALYLQGMHSMASVKPSHLMPPAAWQQLTLRTLICCQSQLKSASNIFDLVTSVRSFALSSASDNLCI